MRSKYQLRQKEISGALFRSSITGYLDFFLICKMKILHLLRLGALVAADKRLERKEIDLRKLDKEYEEDDDMELEVSSLRNLMNYSIRCNEIFEAKNSLFR